ncbi:MAG: hypothetical protein HOI53_02940 [Francisellaceae bacterium]|nr:hypothetical protein [Francisellaceae bacterium]
MLKLASKYFNLKEQVNNITRLKENLLTEEDIELLNGQIADLLGSEWPDRAMLDIKSEIVGNLEETIDPQIIRDILRHDATSAIELGSISSSSTEGGALSNV